ncbi:GNAT family N-acetyltransferase [Halobacterium wangiae]|uniref:GNAT family N-acetyltransferase n=1 Tax=Halobacterium wangiae TaxID=2902623 RepID=UPI001E309391|nr:GNAT family protein [Halobacterium wangiae]
MVFTDRVETDRLVLTPVHDADPIELHERTRTESWQTDVTEHMPWYRFETVNDVAAFQDVARERWQERAKAWYVVRPVGDESGSGEFAGFASFDPEWDERRAGSGVVLARRFWGRGYGSERAREFVRQTFERYDLDAYYTSCHPENEASRRMIESVVERFGGQFDGCLRHETRRPDGTVTPLYRYSILRAEYEANR